MTPTQASLKQLRDRGYCAAVTERWNSFAGVRQDLFGFMDLLAFHPQKKDNVAVQCCARGDLVRRKQKILESKYASAWLRAGNRIELHALAKRKTRGKKRKEGEKWNMLIGSKRLKRS